MKKQVLIVGVGQIGSRHLQGVLRNTTPMCIYVIDPSDDSLQVAKSRSAEVTHEHELHFQNNWNELPATFDLAIIATSANVREKVITQLLGSFTVRQLILEKVLFQDINAYQRVHELLSAHKVTTWVNHPRRMFTSYQKIKGMIDTTSNHTYHIAGANWGLGCNGLHFIDLIVYLSGSRVKSIETDWVDKNISESKRNGYIEFTGTIKGVLENGSVFSITSFDAAPGPITLHIASPAARFTIQEGGTPQVYYYERSTAFAQQAFPFVVQYQSELSDYLLKDLFKSGNCSLPSYEEARQSHEIFINALLHHYIKNTGTDSVVLPIT